MEEIRIQSIRFDADQKLLDFVKKKLSKLPKFHDSVIGIDVKLSLLAEHDNKNVWVKVQVPGNDVVVESADVLKEKLKRIKEKQVK